MDIPIHLSHVCDYPAYLASYKAYQLIIQIHWRQKTTCSSLIGKILEQHLYMISQ